MEEWRTEREVCHNRVIVSKIFILVKIRRRKNFSGIREECWREIIPLGTEQTIRSLPFCYVNKLSDVNQDVPVENKMVGEFFLRL